MSRTRCNAIPCAAVVGICMLIGALPILAEDTGGLEEVIVTARKRQESILNVPVVEQVIPQAQLQALQVTELTDLPKITPGLNFGHSLLSIGTFVSIRGIGTSSSDPGVDQSVSLNIDGLSLGNGLAFSSGLFDVGQIEVLKGPQALFYGKSSPGGVIAIRTADPTDQVEVIGRAAYEFESVNPRGELIVSGPVTDTLKVRLAGMYSSADGYFNNVATALPGTGALTPSDKHSPDSTDYQLRGTALWNPVSQLTARLKANFVHDRAINAESSQCTDAPTGTTLPLFMPGTTIPAFPPLLAPGSCRPLSRTEQLVFLDPAAFPVALNNGVPFLETHQAYGSLDLNYAATESLSVTSTTGYYNLSSESMVNPTESSLAGPFLGIDNHFHRREATEEVRANSDFKGPVNFTLGALYEDGLLTDHVTVAGNTAYHLPALLADAVTPVDIKTSSVFGQARWNIVERLELAGGLRWTDEKRDESPFNFVTQELTSVPIPELRSKRYSPEVTLTYRPTDDLTTFAAWKQGYKSGSFSVATPVVAGTNNSFGDERVNGGEAGLKGRLLDRQLSFDIAVYDYLYDNLQVGAISPPVNGLPVIQTVNAATARTYGVDFDSAYRPAAVAGLAMNASVEWNHGRYLKFNNAPCWGGQLVSEGCNQAFLPVPKGSPGAPGYYTAQDLSGTPLIRAPEWQANIGFDYEVPISSGYALVFTNNNEFSSRYVTFLAVDRPNNDNYQGSFAKIDLGLTLRAPGGLWEVALIGKDINDKITSGECNSAPLLTGATVATPYGTATRSPFGIDPVQCFPDAGREVWLRLTVRPLAPGP
jgi:iron complex outermembrane recepter protein